MVNLTAAAANGFWSRSSESERSAERALRKTYVFRYDELSELNVRIALQPD